uniref:Extracellular solute-binding protein n=2 Tax=Thermorudis TaxID=1649508 RepID=A0A831WZC0_9BACT
MGRISRRQFLVLAGAATGSVLLAACGGEPAATPTPTAQPTPTPQPSGQSTAPSQAQASTPTTTEAVDIDLSRWSPDYVREIAGTIGETDTRAFVSSVVPLETTGNLSYWYIGPAETDPQISKDFDKQFWDAWESTYPGISTDVQRLTYADMLDKIRTAATGNAAPMVATMPILWGVEFAAKGQLAEISPEEFGFKESDFWPGALKSCRWQGKLYGLPTNNESMALIWNKQLFREAGLDPDQPPATWEDLVIYSKQIKDATGKYGYGLVARQNHGNTPFRFMPIVWAYGGGAFDEAEESPTYQSTLINNEGSIAALEIYYNLFVRDQSVPASALTNTNAENTDLFFAGQLGMYIGHPSEFAVMVDRANKATGADKERALQLLDNIGYALLPEGPVRRAVVLGGSNIHIFNERFVRGGKVDRTAARAFIAFRCSPEWSIKAVWASSNPGTLQAFGTSWMQQRLEQVRFLEVTTAMLKYGVPFPVVPESTQIMNIIIPDMIHNALTGKMTVKEAANDAAEKIRALMKQRPS